MNAVRIRGRLRGGLGLALLGFLALPVQVGGADDWKYDILRLKNGAVFKGLLVEESETEVRFRNVRRNPGQLTVVIPPVTFDRSEIAGLDKLSKEEREVLKERLDLLDPTGKREQTAMEGIEIKPGRWVRGNKEALIYESVHFQLISNAQEDIIRRSAVRLEQIYGAYTRYLPPRQKNAKATTIILVNTAAEYDAINLDLKLKIRNPAYYHPGRNEVVCLCDLGQLAENLERVRKKHNDILKEQNDQERALKSKKLTPAQLEPILKRINAARQEIYKANAKNDGIFAAATNQLFETLYHEAFHAYLANFVYPRGQGEVPRWLNEGLAQIFETAIVEAGELRVGHVHKARLGNIHDAAKKNQLIALPDLLKSGPRQFLVDMPANQLISDRFYLNSWALASYLMFDRNLAGTRALDDYVQALARGTNELEAFRALVGKPLGEFEKDYHIYLSNLRPDGTAKLPKK